MIQAFFSALVFLILSSCGQVPAASVVLEGPDQTVTVAVDIADDPQERARGLMGRTSLPGLQGMLFIMPQEQVQGFWMSNTLIPLDILFFDHRGTFVSSTTMTPCEKEPCTTYLSMAPALYALEVPAGFIERHGVTEGWKLQGMGEGKLWRPTLN